MHKILRNQFISDLRKNRHTVPLDDAKAELIAVEQTHDDRLVVRALNAALDRLPAPQREALLLATLSELSHEQVANVMGCRVGTVKSRLNRARSRLEIELTEGPPPADAKRPAAAKLADNDTGSRSTYPETRR